jgi:hypothetical protein
MSYIARRLPGKSSVPGRILLWTIVPFIPAFVVSVLLTGSLLKR